MDTWCIAWSLDPTAKNGAIILKNGNDIGKEEKWSFLGKNSSDLFEIASK